MKSVFIFGAGASRQAGGPLMSDFFDKAERLLRHNKVPDAKAEFEEVFKAISELQPMYAKSYFDLDNLEMVFGAIEMGQLIHKFAGRTPDEIARLRNAMVTLIVKTLEQSIFFPTRKGEVRAPKPYMDFAEMLSNVESKTRARDYSFITFNYDVALDYALFYNNIPTDYYLADDIAPNNSAVPLLKLHGSINWGRCPTCNEIVPYEVGAARFTIFRQDVDSHVLFDLGSKITTQLHKLCSTQLVGPPIIVPPTWDKTTHHAKLVNVWRRAAKELGSAENIFVIGYSLPDSDLFFRYLFSLGSEGETRVKRLWVIDPDRNAVEPRFRRLIGRGLENRFQFHESKFEDAIPIIKIALEDE